MVGGGIEQHSTSSSAAPAERGLLVPGLAPSSIGTMARRACVVSEVLATTGSDRVTADDWAFLSQEIETLSLRVLPDARHWHGLFAVGAGKLGPLPVRWKSTSSGFSDRRSRPKPRPDWGFSSRRHQRFAAFSRQDASLARTIREESQDKTYDAAGGREVDNAAVLLVGRIHRP